MTLFLNHPPSVPLPRLVMAFFSLFSSKRPFSLFDPSAGYQNR
jgi:hypothetical protein